MGDSQRPISPGQEVGETRHHADVDLWLQLLQGLGKNADMAARDDLSILETGMGS